MDIFTEKLKKTGIDLNEIAEVLKTSSQKSIIHCQAYRAVSTVCPSTCPWPLECLHSASYHQ